jgi:hypothetical protein
MVTALSKSILYYKLPPIIPFIRETMGFLVKIL